MKNSGRDRPFEFPKRCRRRLRVRVYSPLPGSRGDAANLPGFLWDQQAYEESYAFLRGAGAGATGLAGAALPGSAGLSFVRYI